MPIRKRHMNSRILFFILIFASVAIIRPALAQSFPSSATVPPDAIAVALLALSFSLDVVAIGFIVSKLFPQTAVGEWLPSEYWEIAKSAMLVVGIYALLAFMTNVSTSLIPTTGTNIPQSVLAGTSNAGGCPGAPASESYVLVNSACYYLNYLNGQMGTSFTYLVNMAGALGALSSASVSIYTPVPLPGIGFKFGFAAGFYKNSLLEGSGVGQFQSILNDFLTYIAFPMALLINVQLHFITFVFVAGLYVLIPLGLMFRALPFTRGIGGALIGIGIGMSIVYPSLLVLFNYPVTSAFALLPNSAPPCSGLFCPVIAIIMAPFNFLGVSYAVGSMNTIFPALNQILNANSYLLMQFILFILDLGIGYSIANGIARVLGGQIRYSITDKIKLA